METLHSPWIKWRLIFHHWITNLTVGGLYKYTGEIWAIRSSKIQNWLSGQNHWSWEKSTIFSAKNRWFFEKNRWSIGKIADFFNSSGGFFASASTRRFFADLSVLHRYFANISAILPIFGLFFRRSIIGDDYRFSAARSSIFLQNISDISRFFNPWVYQQVDIPTFQSPIKDLRHTFFETEKFLHLIEKLQSQENISEDLDLSFRIL